MHDAPSKDHNCRGSSSWPTAHRLRLDASLRRSGERAPACWHVDAVGAWKDHGDYCRFRDHSNDSSGTARLFHRAIATSPSAARLRSRRDSAAQRHLPHFPVLRIKSPNAARSAVCDITTNSFERALLSTRSTFRISRKMTSSSIPSSSGSRE
jgi:hypothetical protein